MRTFLRTTVDNSGDAFGCPGSRPDAAGNVEPGGGPRMTDQPGDLGAVWNRVIADLSGASAESGSASLSPQQRAFLRLTRPLGLLDGTALLAAPSEFAKD